MSNLASAFRLVGRNNEAIALLEKVMATRESRLEPDHPDTMMSVSKLAAAYQAVGRMSEAIPLHRRELESSRVNSSNHPDTLTAMNNLATALQVCGRLNEALPLLEETLALRRASSDPTIPTHSPR